jgi:hypothetical protein
MSVENKGWAGGDSSMADRMFDSMWGSSGPASVRGGVEITEGPLASWDPSTDPVVSHREAVARAEREIRSKTAGAKTASIASDDSGPTAGNSRIVQSGPQAADADDARVSTRPDDARSPPEVGTPKRDKAPSGPNPRESLMQKIKAKAAEQMAETRDPQGGGRDGSGVELRPKLTLSVQDPAPIPKELTADSAFAGLGSSHAKAAAIESPLPFAEPLFDVEVDPDVVRERLSFAGVPAQPLSTGSALWQAAESVLRKEAASDSPLLREDLHPLRLMEVLEKVAGDEWRDWEPETIVQTLTDVAGTTPPETILNKVMAVKIALRRPDVFFEDWQAFEKIAVAFNDVSPTMGVVEDVPIEWLSNAVAVMRKIAGDGDFSEEVSGYTAARLYDSGYVIAPPLLRFSDPRLGDLVSDDGLRKKVILAYARHLGSAELVEDDSDPVSVQVARLMRNHVYVMDKFDESRS